ncbi:tail fiber assembly protein [Stenotrophomonas sp. BIGb0135]|uniref:tail fiber assembly protein n=1 Tax=Stenotrophomonas sp. BIGb0135 TaxID=2940620 RepID=UPI00216AA9CA|nr:tail fiber assembly protein [Stenotrophomonas sp. BIGb0135]
MFAITDTGYRAVTADMALSPGETRVDVLPAVLLTKIRGEQMKAERSQRLRSTDWTQMDDAPLSLAEKLAYGVYRQALRDLPALAGFPDVVWPQPPGLANGAAGDGGTIRIP